MPLPPHSEYIVVVRSRALTHGRIYDHRSTMEPYQDMAPESQRFDRRPVCEPTRAVA